MGWQIAIGMAAGVLINLLLWAYGAPWYVNRRISRFQNELVNRHYDEVETMYRQMRGWRHDYHNHMQTLKAYMTLGQYRETIEYLDRLEEDLAAVDTVLKTGNVMVDGLGVGDVGNIVLRDRQHLAEEGIIIVVLTLQAGSGQVLAGPDIVSRGFVYVRGSESLMDEAKQVLYDTMEQMMDKNITDWTRIKMEIKESLGEFVWKETKRRPMIIPIIMEV